MRDSIEAMQQVISIVGQHALLVVFFNVLLSQGGLNRPGFAGGHLV